MEVFDNMRMDKSHQRLMETMFLGIMEFILEAGVDESLSLIADASDDDLKVCPRVREALLSKGRRSE